MLTWVWEDGHPHSWWEFTHSLKFFFFLNFLFKYSWLTMLCQFLMHSKMTLSYTYIIYIYNICIYTFPFLYYLPSCCLNRHLLIPNSQTIPLPPPPPWQPSEHFCLRVPWLFFRSSFLRTWSNRDIEVCTEMFVKVVFHQEKYWKQVRCPQDTSKWWNRDLMRAGAWPFFLR